MSNLPATRTPENGRVTRAASARIILTSGVDFLTGNIILQQGIPRDYATLARFHYVPVRPATWARVWVAQYLEPARSPRTIGVAALSYPSAVQRTRHRVFGLSPLTFRQRLLWNNAHLRTISRVIIHPQFRSLGIARHLVEALIAHCPTRFVEASARMGRAHPLFERAGMTRVEPVTRDEPVYYHFDKLSR